jgi:hypothetical protein
MTVFSLWVCKGFLREPRPKHQSWYLQGMREGDGTECKKPKTLR